MKVVYHCFGGAHASPTAAAIHLGIIRYDQIPTFKEFKKIPFFDCMTSLEHGKLIKVGEDSMKNEIFILGRRNAPKLVINLIREFANLCDENSAQYYFVDCVQLYNPFMVTGGFSSRGLGFVKVGRPLVTFGTIISFPILVAIVQRTVAYLGKFSQ